MADAALPPLADPDALVRAMAKAHRRLAEDLQKRAVDPRVEPSLREAHAGDKAQGRTGETYESYRDAFCDQVWLQDGLAASSLASYRRDLASWSQWLDRRGTSLLSAQRSDVEAFLADQFKAKAKTSSIARRLSSLRRFYALHLSQGTLHADPTLRALASEGLVDVTPRHGASVTTLSQSAAREMVEVRATLEGLNARLAVRHATPELLAETKTVLDEGNAAAAAGRSDDLIELNARFHDLLAQAGANTILGEMMRSLRDRTNSLFINLSAAEVKLPVERFD